MVIVVELKDFGLAVYEGCIKHFYPFDGLEHEYTCYDQQCACFQSAHQREDDAYDAVEHEDFSAEEGCVETSETEEKEHAPAEAQAEVLAAAGGIAVHDVEAETEEECKDGVCLAAYSEPKSIPYHLVGQLKEGKGRRLLVVEVEVLYAVKQDNHGDGYAAYGIDNLDA